MKQAILIGIMSVAAIVFVVMMSQGNHFTAQQADAAATAGGGLVVAASVATAAGGTSILLANSLRKALRCMDIDSANPVYLTFGQTPTTSNGFYLSPGAAATPVQSPSSIAFPSTDCSSTGCVPLQAVNAIATGGAAKVVCWED